MKEFKKLVVNESLTLPRLGLGVTKVSADEYKVWDIKHKDLEFSVGEEELEDLFENIEE
jgi:hypothetical protein